MKVKEWLCLILFLFLFSKEIIAQEKPFAFNVITGSKNVSFGKINGITQDKWGYMWFVDQSNSQLIKYDGYRMKAYKHNPADINSINPGGFECIAADSLGNVWLPVDGGVDKLNSNTGVATHYKLKLDGFGAVLVDHLGMVWVGANILCKLDPKTGKSVYYKHDEQDSATISTGDIRVLYEDHEGTIWVGNGYPFAPGEDGGLNKFKRATGKFTRYLHNPNNPNSLINNRVRAILEDSRGVFWVGTQGDGLHIMNRKTGMFERLTYDPVHAEKLSRPPITKDHEFDYITFIKEDISGDIWIGTYHQGITRYDPVAKVITHFVGDKITPMGFADSTTWCAFTSRDGTLWIATETSGLLYSVDAFRRSINTISTGAEATSFVEDKNGYLWAATDGNGIFQFDSNQNVLQHFKNNPSDSSSLPENHPRVNLTDNEGDKIWIGSYNGLRVLNADTKKLSRFGNDKVFKDSVGFGGFNDAILDKNGMTWFACWGRGLIRYNPKDHSTKQFLPDLKDSNSISTIHLNHLIEDKTGRLWIIGENGINNLNKHTGSFKHYLSGTFIVSIYEDSRNNIWAGTQGGLYRYNEKTDSFLPFFDIYSDLSSVAVGSIIEDNNQNLWFNSNSALIKLNLVTKQVFIYGAKFGISKNSMDPWIKAYKNKKGQLFFGNLDGFCIFYPRELNVNTNFKVILTDFFINTIPVLPGKDSFIQEPVEELNNLDLNYNQNNIAFEFSAFDYRDPESIRYYTMLEGYDNIWRQAKDEESSYNFNLPPGKYIYHIKAYNKDGTIAEKIITITINPPWWLTWWFITLAVTLAGSTFYSLIRMSIHRKFRTELERTGKEKQIAELNQKATELEMQSLRAQMNPHFIFNSLNSINMFILENNKLQASEYLSKFSRLVRLILQNSQEAFIPLDKELEALGLYLELESLRFDQRFEYKIIVNDDVDPVMLKVPPLIIQPYAENSIWHGLMQKKEKGHLTIELYVKEEMLFYVITDDGIGRKKAAELKSKSAETHKSMGMRITTDRLLMLQQQNEKKNSILITDLILADGSPGGTEVRIKTPVRYD